MNGTRSTDETPTTPYVQLPLVARTLRPEVDQHDAQAVEGVEQHRADQSDLHQPHDRVLVGLDHGVVDLGGDPDHRGVEDVGEEEEEDQDPGDAVRRPRTTCLHGPDRAFLLESWPTECLRCRRVPTEGIRVQHGRRPSPVVQLRSRSIRALPSPNGRRRVGRLVAMSFEVRGGQYLGKQQKIEEGSRSCSASRRHSAVSRRTTSRVLDNWPTFYGGDIAVREETDLTRPGPARPLHSRRRRASRC